MRISRLSRSVRRAFTLIELLTVIAITAILMTLILVPLIDSFNLTRSAQGWARAQDRARELTEQIAREINQAVSVRPNTGALGELDIEVPLPGGASLAGYDTSIGSVRIPIYNAKIDLIEPAQGDPTLMAGGAFINPVTGLGDPTRQTPMGQVNLPASQGLSLVRYFVGLRDPLRLITSGGTSAYVGYREPYTGLLEPQSNGRDNLYVLYRAEVPQMIWSAKQAKFVVNKAFFFDLGRLTATGATGPYYDDPRFFDPAAIGPDDLYTPQSGAPVQLYDPTNGNPNYDIPDPDGTPDPSKAQMVQNWLRVAAIQTEVDRFDMIQPVYDLTTRQVAMANGVPRLMTLIQFTPSHIGSEPAEGQMAVRLGQETDAATSLAPDVFQTKYLGWSNSVLSLLPGGYLQGNPFEVGLLDGASPGFDVWLYNPAQDGPDPNPSMMPVGYKLIDDSVYEGSLSQSIRAPLSRSMNAADYFDVISGRGDWLADTVMRQNFAGFFGEANKGRVNISNGIDEIGMCATMPPFTPSLLPDPINNPNNLPVGVSWDPAKADPSDPSPTVPKTPFNDYPRLATNQLVVDLSAGVFSDLQYSTINRKFNKLWFDYPNLRGQIQRFVDLRVTPNSDGAPSPLNPDPKMGFARASIVPGSEQIFGPDQNPGPDYGNQVRYYRTTRTPGPNQYRINYTDLREPNYALLGLPSPPPTYTPTDLTSAVFQPQYKAGYVEFNSDPNVPLPALNGSTTTPPNQIQIYYRFQFSRPGDSMVVDYDSRQLMTVKLTIRDYPQSSEPNPQTVTLYSQAQVRNFLR